MVRGSKLLRHVRHATDMSVASETARRAGRARLARGRSVNLVCLVCLVHLVHLVYLVCLVFLLRYLMRPEMILARTVAYLEIPSRRSLLQHDEYAKGEVSTQYAQETLKS